MKIHLIIAVCAAALFVPASAGAQGRCVEREPCTVETAQERIRQRVQEGTERVIRNTNREGRVNEARRTLEECVRCAIEAAQDGANRLVNGNSSEQRQSREPDDRSR